MNVVDLDDRRPSVLPARCRCGCEWFVLRGRWTDPAVAQHGVVTLSADGNVTGYCGHPVCSECGEPWS